MRCDRSLDPDPLGRGLFGQQTDREIVTSEIVVADIRVAANIGFYAHEAGRRQALIVEVRLGIGPVFGDALADTIDYNAVVEHAVSIGETHVALIETFARQLAEACLAHPTVHIADVVVVKPGAIANGTPSTRLVLRKRLWSAIA